MRKLVTAHRSGAPRHHGALRRVDLHIEFGHARLGGVARTPTQTDVPSYDSVVLVPSTGEAICRVPDGVGEARSSRACCGKREARRSSS